MVAGGRDLAERVSKGVGAGMMSASLAGAGLMAGFAGGAAAGFETPAPRDVAAVVLVCSVVYAMRHAGGTVAGVIGRLESFRRAAR